MCQPYQVIFNPAAVMIIAANFQTTEENNESTMSWLTGKLRLLPAKTWTTFNCERKLIKKSLPPLHCVRNRAR